MKTKRTRHLIALSIAIMAFGALPGKAFALCNTPTAPVGSLQFFTVDDMFKYCDSTDTWVDWGSGGAASAATPDRGIQFNSGGVFHAVPGFTFTAGNNRLVFSSGNNVFITGGNDTSTGIENTFMGVNAGNGAAAGNRNTAMGYISQQNTNSGHYNASFGSYSLSANTNGEKNTAIGHAALYQATASNNTAIGADALYSTLSGKENVAVGTGALFSNTGNDGNTAVGFESLTLSTGGTNTALGWKAGSNTTTGLGNILIGYGALAPTAATSNYLNIGGVLTGDMTTATLTFNGTGAVDIPAGTTLQRPAGNNGMLRYNSDSNKFEGFQNSTWTDIITAGGTPPGSNREVIINDGGAFGTVSGFEFTSTGRLLVDSGNGNVFISGGNETTTGIQNTFVGDVAGLNNTTGTRNTFIGQKAGNQNTQGERNTFLGEDSGYSNTLGNLNVYVGEKAGVYNETGSQNVFIGKHAARGVPASSDVSNNVILGISSAMNILTGGDRNTIVGASAGLTLTTGADNILIGNGANVPLAATSNHLNIGNTIYGDLSTGNVGIGTAAPDSKLTVFESNTDTSGVATNMGTFDFEVAPTVNHSVGAVRRALSGYAAVPVGNTVSKEKIRGVDASAENYGTGSVASVEGVYGWGYNAANATVTDVMGGWIGSESDMGTVTNLAGLHIWTGSGYSGGTVTNMYGLSVGVDQGGAGTVTNRYGIHLNTPAGTATNDFGIYQQGTQKNYFNGNVGIGTTSPASRFVVAPPAVEVIGAAATITANACGTAKQISATANRTTNTTNTFTSPTASYAGCCMDVINVDTTDTITLDQNAKFFTGPGTDVALGPGKGVRVCSDGTSWYQAGGVSSAVAGGAALSGITAATGGNTIASGTNAQVWNWALTGATADAFTFGETTAATGGSGDQSVLKATTLAASTATPLMVTNLGNGNSFRVNDATGDTDTSPFLINNAGQVLAGTATPYDAFVGLQVHNETLAAYQYITTASANNAQLYFGNNLGGSENWSSVGINGGEMLLESHGSFRMLTGADGTSLTIEPTGAYHAAVNVRANTSSKQAWYSLEDMGSSDGASIVLLRAGGAPAFVTQNDLLIDSTDSIYIDTGGNWGGTSTDLTIKNDGKIGIGTGAPATQLHVVTTSTAGNAVIEALRLSHEDSNSAASSGIGASLTFNLETATNGTFREAAKIEGVFDDATNTSKDGSLRFYTMGPDAASGTTTTTERMRINSAGNVGIGTAASTSRLHVAEPGAATATALFERSGQTTDGFWTAARLLSTKTTNMGDGFGTSLSFNIQDDASGIVQIGSIGSERDGADDSGAIVFETWNAGVGGEKMRISSEGYVGIGMNNPSVELDVTGDIEYTGTITDVSDMRLKEDIKPLGSMLDKVGSINTYSFRMKDDKKHQTEFGVMAQELEEIFPELVKTAEDEMGTKSVNYVGLIAPMIEATKELKAENENLKAELAAMKTQMASIDDLRRDVKGLKAHTGYGINKAEIGIWVLVGMGFMGLIFVSGNFIRTRRREE